jgi:hypothetical protein
MPPTGDGSSIHDRARSGVDPQLAIGERNWDDLSGAEGLLTALREREEERQKRLTAQKAFKLKDDAVKGLLTGFHLGVGEQARIGEFVIKKTERAGNSVAFETQPREQLSIKATGSGGDE